MKKIMKRLFSRLGSKSLLFLALIFSSVVFWHVFSKLGSKPDVFLDLQGEWRLCLPGVSSTALPDPKNCQWQAQSVPHLNSPNSGMRNFNWLIYEKKFTTPKGCKSGGCSFLASEVGDSARVKLNGQTIYTHGGLPPAKVQYAKHYPLRVELAPELLNKAEKENTLQITVFSTKLPQSGIRGSIVGIVASESAKDFSVGSLLFIVIIPFACAILLLLGALPFGFLSRGVQKNKNLMKAYVASNLGFALFLISFSNLPREILPLWSALHLHFFVRYVSDWAFFNLVKEYFSFKGWVFRWIQGAYFLAISMFALSAIFQFSFFDSFHLASVAPGIPYKITKKIFILKLLPMFLGLFGIAAAYRKKIIKGKEFMALLLFFVPLTLMQINDIAFFLGYIQSVYFVKFYPLGIGVFFGVLVLRLSLIHI